MTNNRSFDDFSYIEDEDGEEEDELVISEEEAEYIAFIDGATDYIKSKPLSMPYDEVVERIALEAQISEGEVVERINEKIVELGGFATLEDAAHIIARELEVDLYDSSQILIKSISDLVDGMTDVIVTAMIKDFYMVSSFSRKDGTRGVIQKILLIDQTGSCRLVLWDDQIKQFTDYGLSQGCIIRIINADVKKSRFDELMELYVNYSSEFELNPENVISDNFPRSLLDTKVTVDELSANKTTSDIITSHPKGCLHCGKPLTTMGNKCSYCESEVLKCSVCKLPVFANQEAGKCSLCGVIGHYDHMFEWVKVQGKCASCLQELPVEGIIPLSEIDITKKK